MACRCLRDLIVDFFDYETPVILRTKAKRVGIIHRLIQIATLAFIFVYSIAYLKGYQLTSDAITKVIQTRVRGEINHDFSEMLYEESFLQYCGFEPEPYNPGQMAYFHGGEEFLVPLDIEVLQQKRSTCPEDPYVPGSICKPNNNTCAKNVQLPLGNGKMTGKCVPSIITKDYACEVSAWCPIDSKYLKSITIDPNFEPEEAESTTENTENQFSTEPTNSYVGLEDEQYNIDPPHYMSYDPYNFTQDYYGGYNYSGDDWNQFLWDKGYNNSNYGDFNYTGYGFDGNLTIHQDFNPFGTTRSRSFFRPDVYKGLLANLPKSTDVEILNLTVPLSSDNGTVDQRYYFFARQKLWENIRNVTVIVKNPIYFPTFDETRANYNATGIPCWKNPDYNAIEMDCPIFSFADILTEVADRIDNVEAKDLVHSGGVISGIITWNCDFDMRDKQKSCDLRYTFKRVDEARSGIGRKSWYINTKREDGELSDDRIALRVSSIRFIFTVEGKAGRFSLIQLLYRLGAGAGLFSIATLLCEYVFLNTNWMVKKTVVEMKYLEPTDGTKQQTQSLFIVGSRSEDNHHA